MTIQTLEKLRPKIVDHTLKGVRHTLKSYFLLQFICILFIQVLYFHRFPYIFKHILTKH